MDASYETNKKLSEIENSLGCLIILGVLVFISLGSISATLRRIADKYAPTPPTVESTP